jgi:hypothetical protein
VTVTAKCSCSDLPGRAGRASPGHGAADGTSEKITIDKSGANTAAIDSHNAEHEAGKAGIGIRQIKYLNNIVEQDHRAIKRLVRPMPGFKSFWSAAVTLAGIELMHMIRKGQLRTTGEMCPARQFYSLAGKSPSYLRVACPGNLRQNLDGRGATARPIARPRASMGSTMAAWTPLPHPPLSRPVAAGDRCR